MTEIWKNQEQEWAVLEHYRRVYASLLCKLKDIRITDASVCSALEECLPGIKADDFSVAAVYTCYKLFEASLETIVATEGLSAVMIAAGGILSGLLYGVLAISALAISAMVICAAIDMHEDAFSEVEMGSGADDICADFETAAWDAEAEDDAYEEGDHENEICY